MNEKSKFIKSMQMEITKTFNIPHHKLKNLNITLRSDIEKEEKEFFELCIIPWIKQYIHISKKTKQKENKK
jgi:phage portal protein BeeE